MLQADPYQLRWLASRFSAAADEIRSKATAIERISSDVTGGTSGWKGDAAQGFVQKAESLTHEVREAVRDFAAITEALQTLAYRVEQIQMKQQHLQNLQQERSHLHFGLDLSVDAEIARLDGHIWALEAEITADRIYADMAAATSFRTVQFHEMFPDFFDFAEGVAASVIDNVTGSDLLEPAFPEDRSNWYKAGRVAGDIASAVTGAEEMLLGLGAVSAGDAEAILTSPTVALPLVGVGVAAVGAGAVAQGYKTFGEATKRLSDDVSLFKAEGSDHVPEIQSAKEVEIVNDKGESVGEFDEIDMSNRIFYEDKSAKGLDRVNPKTGLPAQTPQQFADKQILTKTRNRIHALENAASTRATKNGSTEIPDLDSIKNIREFIFRLDGDTPELRQAVETSIEQLRKEFPEYKFSAIFGGK